MKQLLEGKTNICWPRFLRIPVMCRSVLECNLSWAICSHAVKIRYEDGGVSQNQQIKEESFQTCVFCGYLYLWKAACQKDALHFGILSSSLIYRLPPFFHCFKRYMPYLVGKRPILVYVTDCICSTVQNVALLPCVSILNSHSHLPFTGLKRFLRIDFG